MGRTSNLISLHYDSAIHKPAQRRYMFIYTVAAAAAAAAVAAAAVNKGGVVALRPYKHWCGPSTVSTNLICSVDMFSGILHQQQHQQQ